MFKLRRAIEHLIWVKPDVLFVRLHDDRERGYRERVVTGPDARFVRFERIYGGSDSRLARVGLTPDRGLAQLWQNCPDARSGWRVLREEVTRSLRSVVSVNGAVYDREQDSEVMQFVRGLVASWKTPSSTVGRARGDRGSVWADVSATIGDDAMFIGPTWVGAGRRVSFPTSIVGPAVLWDDPAARPDVEELSWLDIEPTMNLERTVSPARRTGFSVAMKRLFDVTFALLALLLTLPLYPFIMLAIWLEDGRPFFFSHERESVGGRKFGCVKFRSMRKDADLVKRQLAQTNQADGPQFFIDQDPRITRVGRFLRRTYLDELPQFWNVLLGHMSVVGPRPSPFAENQYCPPWREARLSVRPGMTGLWQIKRTRRTGLDFQEWIKYDIEYVENMSWWVDLKIISETVRLVVRGVFRS